MQTHSLIVVTLLSTLMACSSSPGFVARTPHTAPTGQHAVAVVRVRSPWYAPRFVIRGKFHDVLGEYEAIAPLLAKYFTISDDGEFGGIYLWESRSAAEAHFDAAWHARVREKRGVDGDVQIVDAPLVIDGPARPLGELEGARSLAYPAYATFVRWELPDSVDLPTAASTLAEATPTDPAMIRAFVVTAPHTIGVVTLWATRAAADRSITEDARALTAKTLNASRSTFVAFEAPLLIDATLRPQ